MVEVNAGTGGFLVSSEVNYPGWRATVDGNAARIVQTNAAFRGVELPSGAHRIEFRFFPSILWQGLAISVTAVSVVCIACWLL
jgi:uncharacterized membrane protein YfhO